MAKVLLDVGAHIGETLKVARDPKWGFDAIYCFEPAPQCWDQIEALADQRVTLLPFGLWSEDATLTLHDPGLVGASLMSAKSLTSDSVEVQLRSASEWFAANVSASDEVIVKINCEGAECEILEALLTAGELSKIDELVVHFDVKKVPGKESEERRIRDKLEAAGVPYRDADTIFFGKNIYDKTTNWLEYYHATGPKRLLYSVVRRAEFAIRGPIYEFRVRYLRLRP